MSLDSRIPGDPNSTRPGDDWLSLITSNPFWYEAGNLPASVQQNKYGMTPNVFAPSPGATSYRNPEAFLNRGPITSTWGAGGGAGSPGSASAGGGPTAGAGGASSGANAFGTANPLNYGNTTFGGASGIVPTASGTGAGSGMWGSIGNFLQSPGGSSLVQTGANALSNYFTGKAQAEAARAQTAQQDRAMLIQSILNQFNTQQQAQQRGGEVGLQAAQAVPTRQNWRQQQSIWADVLPQLRNVSVNVPGLEGFMPQISGGLRLPEGGLGPGVLSQFSPAARQSAEQDLDRQTMMATGGQYTSPDYASYYGPQANQATDMMNRYGLYLRESEAQPYTQQQLMLRDLLNRAINVNS